MPDIALTLALDAFAALGDLCEGEPRLAAVATLAELAGAGAVRIGHADGTSTEREREVHALRRAARRFELRLPASAPNLKHAIELRPDLTVLTAEVATDASATPLDARAQAPASTAALRVLREAGLRAAALVAPSIDGVKGAHAAGFEVVELHLPSALGSPTDVLGDAVRLAGKLRLEVALGGGLGYADVADVLAAAPGATRVVVGRAVAARAALVGVDRAVRDLRERLR